MFKIDRMSIPGPRHWVFFTMLGSTVLVAPACIEDSDCGVCDPDNLVVQSISGVNYALDKIHLLDPACEGEACPGPFDEGQYFVDQLGPCETAEETLEAVGEDEAKRAEYCRLSPLLTGFGIEFIFNNLLDAQSVERVRKRPDNPNLFEVYDWKQRVVEIEGPITRYNGDYGSGERDTVSRLVNLSCIDNLADQGLDFGHEDYQDPASNPCNQVDPVSGLPRKLRPEGTLGSRAPIWTVGTKDCSSPEDGPDTCCSQCDYLLSTRIARYGLVQRVGEPTVEDTKNRDDVAELLANPNVGTAIECDPAASDPARADKFIACRDFVPFVDRSDEEQTWEYDWAGEVGRFLLPRYDRLRETHPDDRPAELADTTARCTTSSQCTDPEMHGLPGTECVGRLPDGAACSVDVPRGPDDPPCGEGVCVPQWFVSCKANPDTTGGEVGYCQDQRFSDRGTAACYRITRGSFFAQCDDEGENCSGSGPVDASSTRDGSINLAYCDGTEDGLISSGECCQPGLGASSETCDPYFLPTVEPVSRWERDRNLPERTRTCVCQARPAEECEEVVRAGCFDDEGNLRPERAGEFAVKFVDEGRRPGVIYDPAVKGIEWQPADEGGVPRADVEECAEQRALIGARSRHDGWRAHDAFLPETFEDFDRAMCSDSEYTVHFAVPGDDERPHLRDKVGNTLAGKASYTFRTPKFHVVPGSGFPTDNLRIGACGDFTIRFSNKYDLSPENLDKLQFFRLRCDADGTDCVETTPNDECTQVVPVAGGPGCYETDDELDDAGPCAAPCLSIDVRNHNAGEVTVEIDSAEFDAVLKAEQHYRFLVPTAASTEQAFADPNVYQAVFWDACGMPLVAEDAIPYSYDFRVDAPSCREDRDLDDIPFSCDNAEEFFNPDQEDLDRDGIGDVVDLCVTVPGSPENSADSDRDGVGNECDNCRQAIKQYNLDVAVSLPPELRVRNIPFQQDSDGDGIGDVCDNCVVTANCQEFGPDAPWAPGEPIAYDNANLCQRDDDFDMIGDACQVEDPGPGDVGFGPEHDFDQDGIANLLDLCPRQPVAPVQCRVDDDCPGNRGRPQSEFVQSCSVPEGRDQGVCNHLDTDGDDVGDMCDSCASRPNRMQVVEGGMQEDDGDGDFVGEVCETDTSCADQADARPYSFYEVSAHGSCCTVALVEAPDGSGDLVNPRTKKRLVAPARAGEPEIPVRARCSEEDEDARVCRLLPTKVAKTPGILEVPAGCEEALAGLSPLDNRKLDERDFEEDPAYFWSRMCLLPQLDQDFDGLGEPCDLCPFDFDPDNLPYIDDNGRVWPKNGRFCHGDYDIEERCEQDGASPGADTDGDTEGGSSGGSAGSGSSSGA